MCLHVWQVMVMSSIRRPKRLIIRGDDERDHPFLVKGGEDLRQDQRIEQLFAVMNIMLSHDAACTHRGMQLRTYQVIPITTRCLSVLTSSYPVKNDAYTVNESK